MAGTGYHCLPGCEWLCLCCTLQQGGWVLVETILDNTMVEQLSKMIYFQDWRHAMSYTLPEVGTAS